MKNLIFVILGMSSCICNFAFANNTSDCFKYMEKEKYSKAVDYCIDACNKERNRIACALVGDAYQTGIGVWFKNKEKALDYYMKACYLREDDTPDQTKACSIAIRLITELGPNSIPHKYRDIYQNFPRN